MDLCIEARALLKTFKEEAYRFGPGVLDQVGLVAASLGQTAVLIRGTFSGSDLYVDRIVKALQAKGVDVLATLPGAKPNTPIEDVTRIAQAIKAHDPDCIISFGGGSTIDAVKGALVLQALGGSIEAYFGTGLVSKGLEASGKTLKPHIAIQTVPSSGAHLTKYANITDVATGQKKLIVDAAIIPKHPMFDYTTAYALPDALLIDGALDGFSHSLEVLYGAQNKPHYAQVQKVARVCLELIIAYLPQALEYPKDQDIREALCLATDLGGYAIMLDGTNGGHLTSFSLVDLLSHGRACALMNPYYTVFFAPAIEPSLRLVGPIFEKYGYIQEDMNHLEGLDLGKAVAKAMLCFAKGLQIPITLGQVEGFTDAYMERALKAAKDPQLKMKLQNMPIPMTADLVDVYMGSVLESAKTGDLEVIKTL